MSKYGYRYLHFTAVENEVLVVNKVNEDAIVVNNNFFYANALLY